MANFDKWCDRPTTSARPSFTLVMNVTNREEGIRNVSEIISGHYVDIQKALRSLERSELADFIQDAFPSDKINRSGDVGEILATEWVNECCDDYNVPITRLRYKDESKMAMRGVDVVGIRRADSSLTLEFLKGEAKSREEIKPSVINDARKVLDKDQGRITGDTLTYILRMMIIEGKDPTMIRAVRHMSLKENTFNANVQHLIFVFSENNPETILEESRDCYSGSIDQMYVGIYVHDHQGFIHEVYERVKGNV